MFKRYLIGDFEIETATRRLRRRGGETIHLANRPFQVLLHLIEHRERLVTRAELLELFWDGRDVYEDALTRCLSFVRKALDDQGGTSAYIETRWAEGYRFIGPCEEPGWQRPAAAPGTQPQSGRRHTVFSSARNPALLERLVQRGNAHLGRSGLRSQRYALEMFRQASAIDPDDARTHGGLAASHALLYLHAEPREEHRAAAAAAAERALALDPDCAESQIGRAQVALARGDHVEANDAFQKAEGLQPGLFHTWYYHGRGCAEQSDHEGALLNFARAAEANPFDYQALALSEQSFERLGLLAEARRVARACVEAAERVLHRYPDDVRALSLAACMLPQLNREAEARGWTERAFALEPDEPFVNFNAACVYISLRDYERALFYFERIPLAAAGNSNWIAHDPCMDPVRSHPRFVALLPSLAA